jgi:hypothetical protein
MLFIMHNMCIRDLLNPFLQHLKVQKIIIINKK